MATNPIVTPATQKPSLFRQLLGGAILGLASGLSADDAGEAFGAGLEGPQNFADRQLKRDAFIQGQRREDERLALDRQRVGLEERRVAIDERRAMSDEDIKKLQAAHLQIELEAASRKLALLPANKQEQYMNEGRELAKTLVQHGADIIVSGDYDALRAEQLRRMNQDGNFNHLLLPDPSGKADSWALVKVPKASTNAPETITFGNGKSVVVPAGTSVHDLVQLKAKAITEQLNRDTQLEVARIQSQRREQERQLTLKEALTQARAEVNQLVQAEQTVPQSKRQFKSQDDITKAVNKRAQELMDLASQLKRNGIEQPANLMGVLGQLHSLKRSGASEAQLKQSIAYSLNLNQITPQEAVALYDQLGLSPNVVTQTAPAAEPQLVPSHKPTTPQPQPEPYREYHGFGNIMNR